MSFTALALMRLAASQRHDLVRTHADVSSSTKGLHHQAASGAFACRVPGLANASVISSQLEFHLCMRQKTELVTDILGDSNLALSGDLHSNTPTSNSNTQHPYSQGWVARGENAVVVFTGNNHPHIPLMRAVN
jgi:hypothetical protein